MGFHDDWEHCAVLCPHAGELRGDAPATYRTRRADFWYFVHAISGSCTFTCAHEHHRLEDGQSILVPPHLPRLRTAGRRSTRLFTAWFRLELAAGTADPLHGLGLPAVVAARRPGFMRILAEDVLACYGTWLPKDRGARLIANRLLAAMVTGYLLDGLAAGTLVEHPDAATSPAWLNEAVSDLVRTQDGHAWRVDRWAAQLGLSQPSLFRSCQRHLGMAPGRILRRERVHLGLRFLGSTDDPSVGEVARRLGYEHVDLFRRHCRAETGHPPRYWKRVRPRRVPDNLG